MRNYIMLAAGCSALTLVSAQNFTVDPNSVELATRASWCQGESATCNTLCADSPVANDCDPNTLVYHCTCQNGSAPGLEYYQQSMPFFLCNQAFKECNDANVGDARAQKNCTTSILDKCGKLDPNKADIPKPSDDDDNASSTREAIPSPTVTEATSTPTDTGSPSTPSAENAAPTDNYPYYGNGAAAVAMGLFACLL